MDSHKSWVLYGSQLSPFALKIAAGLTAQEVPFRWSWQLPFGAQLCYAARVKALKLGLLTTHIPSQPSPLREFPLVPFVFATDHSCNAYDSTAILHAVGIDAKLAPAAQFVSSLVEEFFDEWGLYLVHNARWTGPENRRNWNLRGNPGNFLMSEMVGAMFIPRRDAFAEWFCARQTRRLPYLFSVGSRESQCLGMPQTRALLDRSLQRLLESLELVFSRIQDCSLVPGAAGSLTAADLACFGVLNMNALLEAGTRRQMQKHAPQLLRWLDQLQLGVRNHTRQTVHSSELTEPESAKERSALHDDETLQDKGRTAVFGECCRMFVPLMQANAEAYRQLTSDPAGPFAKFNEAAFDRGECLFRSKLIEEDGSEVQYESVVKTFQVQVWRDLLVKWGALSKGEQDEIEKWSGVRLGELLASQGPAVHVQRIRSHSDFQRSQL
eukprot:TRINITY_DN51265_c0_g1_i1.p1 TRINITY_DN51265_c0_g1~~TRINITY_DN51265_c0_g1_i1.p1  ORF type:complete len:439 (-),score=39.88 TRINITY_DN51265_c0_g1_i1:24-1340(-)